MEWSWNDGIASRGRRPACIVVTGSGEAHRFVGSDIPGVVKVLGTKYEKNGKWSNSTYRCFSPDGTVAIAMRETWEEGVFWPQATWDEAFAWAREQAPKINHGSFVALLRAEWPKAAEKFDANEIAMSAMAAMGPETVIVTRHAGLVEWLAQRGVRGEGLAQVKRSDIEGKIVVGALPLHLAASAAEVVAIDMPNLTAEQRGRDLTPAEMDEAGASLARYRVQRI